MTPANKNFDIYKGAKWEHTFTLKSSGTNTPLDLTGLGPFVFTVKKPRKDESLFNATITSLYNSTGVVKVTITSTNSDSLIVGTQYPYGMRDALDNPYMVGFLDTKYFAPERA
jgi:hypothetical protein